MSILSRYRIAVACGFAGPAVFVLGTLAPAILFKGSAGESYSPFNHFVSELGQKGISRLAPTFNGAFILGGVLLAVFLMALGIHLGTAVGRIAGALGAYSGLSCSALGFLPMDRIFPHIAAGDSFFMSGLASIALLSGAIIFDERGRLSKWLGLLGSVTAGSFLAFLTLLVTVGLPQDEVLFPDASARPRFYALPIAEWTVYALVLLWVVFASIEYARKARPSGPPIAGAGITVERS